MSENNSAVIESHNLKINYDDDLARLKNGFIRVNPCIIDKNFINNQKGIKNVNLKLISFSFLRNTREILYKIYGMQLFPADIFTVLNFCNKHSNYDFPIIAPYSVWRQYDGCFYIPFAIGKKALDLHKFDEPWSGKSRFAAIDFNLKK